MYADPAFFEEPGWHGDPQRRLRVSLVLGAVLVLAFLSVLKMPQGIPLASLADLVVTIVPAKPEAPAETIVEPAPVALPLPADSEVSASQPVPVENVDPASLPQPASVDLQALIAATVSNLGEEKAVEEQLRAAMWENTRSVMFQPGDELALQEQEPVLEDFRFKPELNIAGIGLKIGSCFFGIPLVGVPVEDRSVAISVVTCAKHKK